MGKKGALHGLVPDIIHRLSGQEVQPVAVDLILGYQQLVLGSSQTDHSLKHDAPPGLDILAHGVKVRGELHAGGEEALAVLALALAVELLPPLGKEAEPGLITGQNFDFLTLGVQIAPGGGVLPGGVGVQTGGAAGFHHAGRALHQLVQVHAGHGDGQQAHGGQHTVASAHVVGDHIAVVALGGCQGLQCASGLVGGSVDALGRALASILFLQQRFEEAEGYGRLGGCAGLGDHVDREVGIADEVHHFLHSVAGQTVSDKVDVGRILLDKVVVIGIEQLDSGPRPQVAPADADNDEGLAVALDFLGGGLNPGIFLLVVIPGQVDPADKVVAPSGGFLEPGVGLLEALDIFFRLDRGAGQIDL